MKKVVWLCSIYPTAKDPFLGDFIERHAVAASLLTDISVVHVCCNDVDPPFQRKSYRPTLRADIINIRSAHFTGYAARQLRFVTAYMTWMADFIKINGTPQLLHVHNSVNGAFIGWLIKKRYGIPYIITEHSSIFLPESGLWNQAGRIVQNAAKIGIRSAAGLSTVSSTLGGNMRKIAGSVPVRIIPDAVDTSLFYASDAIDRLPYFIHNTGPERIKNTLLILRAIALERERFEANHFRLTIFGAYRSDLDKTIAALNIQELVEQKGEVSQLELALQVRQAAALVQCSSYETFGCIVAEALCAGCPVIVSDIPAMRELVKPGYGTRCELQERSVANALASMMTRYTKFSRQEIATESAAAFSYAVVASKFKEWYQTVAD